MNSPLSVAAFPIAKVSGAGARKTDLGQVSLSFTSQRQRDFIEVRNASYARGIDAILLSSSPLVAVLTRYGLPERNGEFPPLLRPAYGGTAQAALEALAISRGRFLLSKCCPSAPRA